MNINISPLWLSVVAVGALAVIVVACFLAWFFTYTRVQKDCDPDGSNGTTTYKMTTPYGLRVTGDLRIETTGDGDETTGNGDTVDVTVERLENGRYAIGHRDALGAYTLTVVLDNDVGVLTFHASQRTEFILKRSDDGDAYHLWIDDDDAAQFPPRALSCYDGGGPLPASVSSFTSKIVIDDVRNIDVDPAGKYDPRHRFVFTTAAGEAAASFAESPTSVPSFVSVETSCPNLAALADGTSLLALDYCDEPQDFTRDSPVAATLTSDYRAGADAVFVAWTASYDLNAVDQYRSHLVSLYKAGVEGSFLSVFAKDDGANASTLFRLFLADDNNSDDVEFLVAEAFDGEYHDFVLASSGTRHQFFVDGAQRGGDLITVRTGAYDTLEFGVHTPIDSLFDYPPSYSFTTGAVGSLKSVAVVTGPAALQSGSLLCDN